LRTACCDTENDVDQVQAILDAARVTIPSYIAPELTAAASGNIDGIESSGSTSRRSRRNQRQDLMSQLACYDHLGNLYVVPLKMFSDPGNLVEDAMPGSSGGGEGSSDSNSSSDAEQSTSTEVARREQHKENMVGPSLGGQQQEETIIRIRLSNNHREVTLSVLSVQGGAQAITIRDLKARLVEEGAVRSTKSFVRVLFLGRVLEDKERLAGVPHFQAGREGTVLQVLVSDP
jgi:hypothetical protein